MNKDSAFDDIKLDAVAMQSLFSHGGEQQCTGSSCGGGRN